MLRRVDLTTLQLPAGCINYFRLRVSQKKRTPPQYVIDVFVSVYIPKMRTQPSIKKERKRLIACANVAAYAAGERLPGTLQVCNRFRVALGHI